MFVCESNEFKAKSLNLAFTENSLFMLIYHEQAEVLFSYSKYGDTMDCHLAANLPGKLILRNAVNSFCNIIFEMFPSIKKITGTVGSKSVENLLFNCGFNELCKAKVNDDGIIKDAVIMARWREVKQ